MIRVDEIEKITKAKMYIEKLANGENPINNQKVADNDVVNNIEVTRCLFYVANILGDIVRNKGKFQLDMPDKVPFIVSQEQLDKFEFSETPITISEICKRLNSLVDSNYIMQLKLNCITEWLVSIEILYNDISSSGKKRKLPTENGINMGIIMEQRVSQYGPYEAVLYNLNAQHFIIDNLDAIIKYKNISK